MTSAQARHPSTTRSLFNHLASPISPASLYHSSIFIMQLHWAIAVAACVAAVTAQRDLQPPATTPVLGKVTSQGCFSSRVSAWSTENDRFASPGSCANLCRQKEMPVAALRGAACYCGEEYPAADTLVEDAKCNYPCPGYPLDACKQRPFPESPLSAILTPR